MDDTIECLKLLQQANKAQQESIVALHEGIVSISTMVQSLGERVAKLENCSPPVDFEPDDYLLIRDGRVIAVSGNSIFDDGDAPVGQQEGDIIARAEVSRWQLRRQAADEAAARVAHALSGNFKP